MWIGGSARVRPCVSFTLGCVCRVLLVLRICWMYINVVIMKNKRLITSLHLGLGIRRHSSKVHEILSTIQAFYRHDYYYTVTDM